VLVSIYFLIPAGTAMIAAVQIDLFALLCASFSFTKTLAVPVNNLARTTISVDSSGRHLILR
jgi:hypothetical protein